MTPVAGPRGGPGGTDVTGRPGPGQDGAVRILVISDTHAPYHWRGVPDELVAPLQQADAILHAGDVATAAVLDDLAAFAPLHVVLGNVDGRAVREWGAPPRLQVELGGLVVGMLHDPGPFEGRGRRLRGFFPGADLVVHGHTHTPFDGVLDGLHVFNPGSAADPRREPVGTYGVLDIADGHLVASRIVPIESTRR